MITQMILRFFQGQAANGRPFNPEDNDEYILKYGIVFKLFMLLGSIACLFPPIMFGYLWLVKPNIEGAQESILLLIFMYIFVVIIALAMAALGLFSLHELFYGSIFVSNDRIYRYSIFGKSEIFWSDIELVEWGESNKWFILRSSNETTIRVSLFLQGICWFVDDLRRRLPRAKYKPAQDGINECESMRKQ